LIFRPSIEIGYFPNPLQYSISVIASNYFGNATQSPLAFSNYSNPIQIPPSSITPVTTQTTIPQNNTVNIVVTGVGAGEAMKIATINIPSNAISYNTTQSLPVIKVTAVNPVLLNQSGVNTWGTDWKNNMIAAIFDIDVIGVTDFTLAKNVGLIIPLLKGSQGDQYCLAYINTTSKAWVCEDTNLNWISPTSALGYTSHFTAFSIILNPDAKFKSPFKSTSNSKFTFYLEIFGVSGGVVLGVVIVTVIILRYYKKDSSGYVSVRDQEPTD